MRRDRLTPGCPLPEGLLWRQGKLYARAQFAGGDRTRRIRAETVGEAEAARDAFRRDIKVAQAERIARASAARKGGTTWREAAINYLTAAEANLKPATVERYEASLRIADPYLVQFTIGQIDQATLMGLVRARRKLGATNATINRTLTAISQVLEHAVAEGLLDRNPVASIPRRRVTRERRDPIIPPTTEEVMATLPRISRVLRQVARFAAETGCRQTEASTLERWQIRPDGTCIFDRTKSSRPRVIDLAPVTIAWLDAIPRAPEGDHVFWHGRGDPIGNPDSQWFREMGRLAAAAEKLRQPFRRFRFHDLRHRFATATLEAGGDLYGLSRHMGHSTVKVTEEYLRLVSPAARAKALAGTGAPVRSLPLDMPSDWAE